jgi:hypothetical protein
LARLFFCLRYNSLSENANCAKRLDLDNAVRQYREEVTIRSSSLAGADPGGNPSLPQGTVSGASSSEPYSNIDSQLVPTPNIIDRPSGFVEIAISDQLHSERHAHALRLHILSQGTDHATEGYYFSNNVIAKGQTCSVYAVNAILMRKSGAETTNGTVKVFEIPFLPWPCVS